MSTSSYDDGTWTTSNQTTRFTYEKWDNYKQTKIEISGAIGDDLRYGWDKGLSELVYDVNGNVLQAKDNYGGRLLGYINSYDGKVLVRSEEAPSYTKQHQYFYYQGIGIGDIGDDGASYRDYASVLSQAQRKQSSREAEYKPVMAADFDANFVPVDRQSGVTSGRYNVNRGDTLMSIATNLWGDRSLWYLIADANGLKGTENLASGTTLTLPNVTTTNLHNSSSTFRPYNGGAVLGDINPTLPEVPPPPIPPEPKAGGCGGVAMIVMIVVAVVATVVTAGAAAVAMAGGIGSVTAGGAWAAGAAIMGGTSAFSAGIIAGAAFAGGFVGSAASQLVGKAMGVVDSFSLRKALAGGITSVATAGIASGLRGLDMISKGADGAVTLSRTGRILQGAISVPANVGANELAGIDTSFSWGNVAVSALTAAAMTSNAVKNFFGKANNTTSFNWDNVGTETGRGVLSAGVNYGIGSAILKGNDRPSWNFKQVAFSAFGHAVGSEINRSRSRAGQIEQEKEAAERAVQSAAMLDKISNNTSVITNKSIDEIARRTGELAMTKMNEEVTAQVADKLNYLGETRAQEQETQWENKQKQREEQQLTDIKALNKQVAEDKADIDVMTLQGLATKFRVDSLVADADRLLGNTTEVTIGDSDGIYGVPELLKRPSNVTIPEQESFLSQVNSSWNKFENDHPFLSEVLGKSAIIGTGMGIGRDIYSSFPKSSQSLMYGFGNTPKGYGFTGFTNKGYGQLYNLNSGNYISEVKPSLSTNVKLAQLSGSLNSGARTGGLWGAGFAVAGRTLDYGLDPNKNVISSEFANDVKWDVAKGSVAGIAGGYAGAATTAAVTGLAMSSMAAGATIGTTIPIVGTLIGAGVGFAVGWGVSYLIEDGVYKPLGFRD